jgi:glycosyltransferase involved in cell wall biosynthesis
LKIMFYAKKKNIPGVSLGVHVFEILNGLTKLGHTIFYADGQPFSTSMRSEAEKGNIQIKSSGISGCIRKGLRFVHMYNIASLISTGITELGLLTAAFKTVKHNKPDVIYRRHSLFNSAQILSSLFKLPYIIEVNGIKIDEARINKNRDPLYLFLVKRVENSAFAKADKYIAVTPNLKDILHSDYKISEKNILVIENGANTDLFKPMELSSVKHKLRLNQNSSYICFTGALNPWQGVEYILETLPDILKVHPDTLLLVVGDGVLRKTLQDYSISLKISDKVIFTGNVPYEKVPLYINASDICVVPKKPMRSGYSPLKLCEYMACGKPVLATRTDGFELLEENQAGILIDPRNTVDFVKAINRLMHNPELRAKMGENGRRYVLENRSWTSTAKKVSLVCEQVIKEYRK